MLVTPSILTNNPQDLVRQIQRLLPYFQHFQIDFTDGIFVPNRLCSIREVFEALEKSNLVDKVLLDLHLMVSNPDKWLIELENELLGSRVVRTIIHLGTIRSDWYFEHLNKYPFALCIALNPEDTVSVLQNTISQDVNSISSIQIMSVNPGIQGNPFIARTLEKITQLRELGYQGEILLDGGVNSQSLPIILQKQYRPDIIAPGSYLSSANDLGNTVKELNDLLLEYS